LVKVKEKKGSQIGKVITFPQGLIGFEGFKNYLLLKLKEYEPFLWLLSLEVKRLKFPLLEPGSFYPRYQPEISKEDLKSLGAKDAKEVKVYCLVSLGNGKTTVNLKGPLLINPKKRLAKQVILLGSSYPLRYPLMKRISDKIKKAHVKDEDKFNG